MTLNKENFEDLWNDINPKLYGYLVNVLRNPTLAQDILQNTWMKAIEKIQSFEIRDNASFSSWLFAIARNECKQHWRKDGREISFDEEIHDKEINETKTEDKIYVDQILSKLPQNDQELIRLRYIADLSINEMAKILKINPITVRVKMHRALKLAKIILKNK